MRSLAGLTGAILLATGFGVAYVYGIGRPMGPGAHNPDALRDLRTGEIVAVVAGTMIPGVVGLGCLGYAFLSED